MDALVIDTSNREIELGKNQSLIQGTWLPKLLKESFAVDLSQVSIADDSGRAHAGAGELRWSNDTGVVVEAETPGEIEMFLGWGKIQVGKIVPKSDHLKLRAKTKDGWFVEAENIVTYPSVIMGRSIIAKWDFGCQRVSFSKRTRDLCTRIVGLARPVKWLVFSRSSHIKSNARKRPRYSLDLLEFKTKFGNVSIQRIAEDAVTVIVEGIGNEAALEDAMESVRLALSFVDGRAVQVVGTHLFLDRKQKFKIWSRQRVT